MLNLNTQNTPVPSRPVQFGAETFFDVNRADDLSATIRRIDRDAVDFVVKEHGEPTPSRTNKHKSALVKSVLAVGGILLSALSMFGAVNRMGAYNDSKPDSDIVALHNAISGTQIPGSVNALEDTANQARKLGVDSELEQRFNTELQALMIDLKHFMQDHPGSGIDEALVGILENSSDFMPTQSSGKLSNNFTAYMARELQNNGVTPGRALPVDVARVDVVSFLEAENTLDGLSSSEKTELANTLKDKYLEVQRELLQNISINQHFDPVFTNALGTGVEGVSLDAFKNIDSKDDVIDLFTRVVSNSKNLENLDSRQKAALVERGTEIINAVEVDGANGSLMVVGIALILAALALGGASVAIGGRKLLKLPETLREYKEVSQYPTVVIEKADKTNPDAKREISVLTNAIYGQLENMVGLMNEVYVADAHVRDFIDREYGGQVPEQQTLLKQFIYNVRQDVVKSKPGNARPLIQELDFTRQLAQAVEMAYETGEFLAPAVEPETEAKPAAKAGEKADSKTVLLAERRKMDNLLRETLTVYASRVFGQAQANEKLTKTTAECDRLKADFRSKGEAHGAQSTEAQTAYRAWKTLENEVGYAQREADDANLMAEHASSIVDEYIPSLRDYRARINEAIEQDHLNTSLEALQKVKGEAGEAGKADPKLQEALREQKIEQYLAKERENKDRIRESVEARVAAKVAEMAGKEGA